MRNYATPIDMRSDSGGACKISRSLYLGRRITIFTFPAEAWRVAYPEAESDRVVKQGEPMTPWSPAFRRDRLGDRPPCFADWHAQAREQPFEYLQLPAKCASRMSVA